MKTNYEAIKNIFTQRALAVALLEIKCPQFKPLDQFLNKADIDFLCWRYVFMKDLNRKQLTNKLIGYGLDNLTCIEVMNSLKEICTLVDSMYEETIKEVKKNPKQVKAYLKGRGK